MPGQTTALHADDGDPTTEGGPNGGSTQEPRGERAEDAALPRLENRASNLGIGPSRPTPNAASESSESQCAHSTQSTLYINRPIPGPPTGAQCAPEQQNAAQPTGSSAPQRRRHDQHLPQPAGAGCRAKPKPRTRKTLRAAVTIASLNISGFGSNNIYHPNNKWLHVNQLMRDKKIGILAIQETPFR